MTAPGLGIHQAATIGLHSASDADADLLACVRAACDWWETQLIWRATSSITGGGAVEAFERAVAPHCLAMPSATSALRLALCVHDLGPGSRIGVPELDWTSTVAVAEELSIATRPLPVNDLALLDVERLLQQPLLLEGLSAVVAVDLHGLTVDVPRLKASFPELIVIEDAARAWGARHSDGSPVGSAADSCVFSFGSSKAIGTDELGALSSRDGGIHQKGVALSQHVSRQLLDGVEHLLDDRAMTRAGAVSALLGAHALALGAADRPARRAAAAYVAAELVRQGAEVVSDVELSSPGYLVVRATAATVRKLVVQTAWKACTPDLRPHRQASDPDGLRALASGLTVLAMSADIQPVRALPSWETSPDT